MRALDTLIGGLSARAALRRGEALAQAGQPGPAFRLLSRAARAGLAEAEYRVGKCYLEGAGVPVSRSDAVRWLEKSGHQGYVEAQSLLATLYLHGLGTSPSGQGNAARLFASNEVAQGPDFEAAARWARRAAEGGSADGQALLGYILTSGPESLRDLDEAREWYHKSAEAGCPQGALGYALALGQLQTNNELNE